MLVFIAPALLAIAQLVSGNPTSGVWNFLEGSLGVLCVLYAVVIVVRDPIVSIVENSIGERD